MSEARDAVDRHVQREGSLPEALPTPELSLVVDYQIIDGRSASPSYALEGRIDDRTLRQIHVAAPGGAR